MDFTAGELADITIFDAKVIQNVQGAAGTLIEFEVGGQVFQLPYNSKKGRITYTRHRPKHWPPQPGDVWQDAEGTCHFGVRYTPDPDNPQDSQGAENGSRVALQPHIIRFSDDGIGSEYRRPDTVNDDFGPLKLVYRQEEATR